MCINTDLELGIYIQYIHMYIYMHSGSGYRCLLMQDLLSKIVIIKVTLAKLKIP